MWMQELPGVHEHLAGSLSGARSAPGSGGQEACAPAQEQDSHSRQGKTAVTFKRAPRGGRYCPWVTQGLWKEINQFFVIW